MPGPTSQLVVRVVKSKVRLWPSVWRNPISWWRLRKLRRRVKCGPASPLERMLGRRMDEEILFGTGDSS